MLRWSAVALLALTCSAGACGPKISLDDNGGNGVPNMAPNENGPSAPLVVGGSAIVVADFLNLRVAAGADATVLLAMPCGAIVSVTDGPSTSPAGWWQVQYVDGTGTPYTGWASGKYMTLPETFVFGTCGGGFDAGAINAQYDLAGTDGALPVAPPSVTDEMFARASLAVGYSYWWGHGAWRSDDGDQGSCSGNCPSCTHDGSYGADCSGFVAKVWQVPSPSAIAVDEHPYSTDDFYNSTTDGWSQVDRSNLSPGDAMVYRSGSEGHIVLVESADDPYGNLWLYEARGCSTGVVHDLRSLDSSYRAIRRDGL
jgi:hypothetical protein